MLPQLKQYISINQASTTAAATASGLIDTLDFDWLTLDVILTTSDAASNNPSVLTIAQCDTSNGTFTNISGLVGDTDFTIPDCETSLDQGYKFNVDLLGLRRWLKLSVSPLTTQSVTAVANLGRGKQSPVTTTKANVALLVEA